MLRGARCSVAGFYHFNVLRDVVTWARCSVVGFYHFNVLRDVVTWARCSVVGWDAMLQAGRLRVRFPMRPLGFSVYLVHLAAIWPWGLLSCGCRRPKTTTSPSSVGRLCRNCENFDVSQPNAPPRFVNRDYSFTFLLYCEPVIPRYWVTSTGVLAK
jgi:hypothetical protein